MLSCYFQEKQRSFTSGDFWEANSHIQVVTPFHDIVFIMSAVALIINNKPAFSQRSEFARFSQMFLSMSCRFVIKCPANYRVYLGVRTCELFLCFVPFVFLYFIVLTSLFSLCYVTGEFNRFLHRG